MNIVDAVKSKYAINGFLLKENFDKKLISVFGVTPEWKVGNTDIIFSIKSVYPYISFRKDKLKRILSLASFQRVAFYPNDENDIGMCLTFTAQKGFKILKNELYSFLWDDLSIPVNEKIVIVERDFESTLIVDRNTPVDSFLDLNLELSDVSMSDIVDYKIKNSLSAISINGLVELKVKTNYKIVNIRSEVCQMN